MNENLLPRLTSPIALVGAVSGKAILHSGQFSIALARQMSEMIGVSEDRNYLTGPWAVMERFVLESLSLCHRILHPIDYIDKL